MNHRIPLLFLSFLFSAFFNAIFAQEYFNVPVTGFNADIVANGGGPAVNSTTHDLDGAGNVLIGPDYNNFCQFFTRMPASGEIYNYDASFFYKLQPYTANNSLRISSGTNGTLSLTSPVKASLVSLLCFASEDPYSAMSVKINFSDGANQIVSGLVAPNRCNGITRYFTPILDNLTRFLRSSEDCDYAACPSAIYEVKVTVLPANYGKTIASVTINNESTKIIHVLAVGRKVAPSPCVGTLQPRTTLASISSACPESQIALSLSGTQEPIPGITYQWQKRNVGAGSFVNINGANLPAYSTTNQTVPTEYRCVETCTSGGSVAASAPVTVNQNPSSACYCTPVGPAGSSQFFYISNVTFAGINSTTTQEFTEHFKDYTKNGSVASVVRGQTYPISITFESALPSASQIAIWIDSNQDGDFGASEFASITRDGAGILTTNITIPANAALGFVRMRVRGRPVIYERYFSGSDQCTNTGIGYDGETEDYLVHITAPCSDSPFGGVTTSTATRVCKDNPFTLSVNTDLNGVTYQWQSKPSGNGSFVSIVGATAATYTVANQTETTEYRRRVTCTSSNLSSYSAPVTVTHLSFIDCYCTPTENYCAFDWISNVKVGTLNNSSDCGGGYSDFTGTVSSVQLAGSMTHTIAVKARVRAANSYAAAWIDLDRSGTFDENEVFQLGSGGESHMDYTFTGTISLPVNVTYGNTRIRIRTSAMKIENNGSCGSGSDGRFGEIEDYLVNIVPPPACTGAPVAGAAASSVPNACDYVPFNIWLSGSADARPDITYQWQSRPSGSGTYAAIVGATTAVYTVSGQTQPTDYRCIVICTSSNTNSISSVITVGIKPSNECYCILQSECMNDYIKEVHMGPLNTVSNCRSPLYTGTIALDLIPGTTYPMSVVARTSRATSQVGVWIDYNKNGNFEAGEYKLLGIGGGSGIDHTFNNSIVIPMNTLFGTTRMRVRLSRSTLDPSNSCSPVGVFGEYEDYLVNILPICVGTPVAGSAQSTAASVTPGKSFTLSLSGASGPIIGLAYQWQSRPAGSGSFTIIPGANEATHTVTSILENTEYRCVLTCTNGGGSATSSPVTVNRASFIDSYCIPTTVICTNEFIKDVRIATLANPTTCGSGGFSNFMGTVAAVNLARGLSYPISVFTRTNQPGSQVGVWIDYDHSGSFEDSEFTLIGTGGGAATDFTFTNSLPISSGALTGNTRMRVRLTNSGGVTTGASCTAASSFGEVEDYLVNIIEGCTGTPAAGFAQSTASGTCVGSPFTLSLTGAVNAIAGNTYQWQSRPAGTGAFTNITGATAATYLVSSQTAAAEYRCVVSCIAAGGGAANSAPVSVAQTSYLNCFCEPTTNVCNNEWIANVQIGSLNNASTCGKQPNGYSDFLGTVSPVNLAQNTTHTISVATRTNQPNSQVGVWIDYNQNSSFEPNEFTLIGTGGGAAMEHIFSGSITIPRQAKTGNTRMRVRLTNSGGVNAEFPCTVNTTSLFGEVEDYMVNILSDPLAITLSKISATNKGTTNLIAWETAAEDPGDRFEIQRSGNALDFATIGTTTAISHGPSKYTFADVIPLSGINYYRLLLLNIDQTSQYSRTVSVKVKDDGLQFYAYPNPVKDILILAVKDGLMRGTVKVLDIVGRTMLAREVHDNSIKINMDLWNSGMYIVKYDDGVKSTIMKVVKE